MFMFIISIAHAAVSELGAVQTPWGAIVFTVNLAFCMLAFPITVWVIKSYIAKREESFKEFFELTLAAGIKRMDTIENLIKDHKATVDQGLQRKADDKRMTAIEVLMKENLKSLENATNLKVDEKVCEIRHDKQD
jgi:hypothetical protein